MFQSKLYRVYSLPNDKILDKFKLKEFADNKVHETKERKFVLGQVENIVGKQENAPFPTIFSKFYHPRGTNTKLGFFSKELKDKP